MHEVAAATRILEEAKEAGIHKQLILEVGELADLEPHEIEEGIQKLSDIKVAIHPKESLVSCTACGYQGRAQIMDRGHGYCIYSCPECEGKVEVIEGGDIRILGGE